ncbi:hypothetical protein HNY73_016729 [Argiope bruennichi]|uniref:Uncharacterized protein n=1 Tax=Argiope bruennichi TaxID=94029 RepID=A0A8T0EJT9_ARGBR|nr:hypothetical protein HNY73_016729 [Argiope bruennichi]
MQKDYLKKCDPEDVSWQNYLQNLKDVAEDACAENSELHLRIVQNIGCFNEVAQQDIQICHNDIDKKTEEMLKYIREIETEEGTNDELWEAFQCLLASLEIQCYASKSSERCGYDAGDLVLELSRSTGFRFRCSVASEEILSKLLALLELELEEEASLNRIMASE